MWARTVFYKANHLETLREDPNECSPCCLKDSLSHRFQVMLNHWVHGSSWSTKQTDKGLLLIHMPYLVDWSSHLLSSNVLLETFRLLLMMQSVVPSEEISNPGVNAGHGLSYNISVMDSSPTFLAGTLTTWVAEKVNRSKGSPWNQCHFTKFFRRVTCQD